MDIIAKSKQFLIKLQNLPDNKKRIIMWAIVGIFAVVMGYFWINGTINRIQKINIQIPSIPSSK